MTTLFAQYKIKNPGWHPPNSGKPETDYRPLDAFASAEHWWCAYGHHLLPFAWFAAGRHAAANHSIRRNIVHWRTLLCAGDEPIAAVHLPHAKISTEYTQYPGWKAFVAWARWDGRRGAALQIRTARAIDGYLAAYERGRAAADADIYVGGGRFQVHRWNNHANCGWWESGYTWEILPRCFDWGSPGGGRPRWFINPAKQD